jgi:hypothetical protein
MVMTEAEWLNCVDPQEMLAVLRGKASDRKLRLFAVACCRRIWQLLPDERSRQAVEVAERYADAGATEEELESASDAACAVWDADMERATTGEGKRNGLGDGFPCIASLAAYNVTVPPGWWGAAPAFVGPDMTAREVSHNTRVEGITQCVLLRDIFGNPFRSVTLDPTWVTPDVLALARAIYDETDFGRMPQLAESLERSGCTNADILTHCRGLGPHAKGCWVIDLILDK